LSVKVAIVGAGSFSTPRLFEIDPALDGSRFQFAFVGRNAKRLSAIKRAATLVARSRKYEPAIDIFSVSDLARALSGAAVVLIQFRIGGHPARCWDETFPHRYGLCGDEGLGAGGLASAWRTWPELSRTLTVIAATAPNALVVIMTAPLGILVRCASTAFPQLETLGICELPWTTLTDFCKRRASADTIRFDYIGVNHIGWFTSITDGERALPGLDAPLPLKYVRLHTNSDDELINQQRAVPRGRQLEELAAGALPIYEKADAETVLETLRRRPTPWYGEAVGPLLNALAGRNDDRWFFLTTRNDGYLRSLSDECIIEIPHRRAGDAFIPARLAARPPLQLTQTVAQFAAYERLAAKAVTNRSVADVSKATLAHPWIGRKHFTSALVRDIVAPVGTVA
jgi:alpha-galactosidase/6-phospho-beta-glucosidase family protein